MLDRRTIHRQLPFLESLAPKDRKRAERALESQAEKRRRAADSRATEIGRIVESVERRTHDLLGAKKLTQLRAGLACERLAFRDLWQPPKGLQRNYRKERLASEKRVDALMRKLGINRAKVRKVFEAADTKLQSLVLPDERKLARGYGVRDNFAKWSKLSPFHKFPLPWGGDLPELESDDPHRWFLFRPPFFGFLFSEEFVTSDNFDADRQMILHPPSGLVGNVSTMDCSDASSFDIASVDARSEIAFAFTAPVAGLIEVLIDAQSTFDRHNFALEDEWGFSNGWCNQNNMLMMNVLHPNVPEPSFATMSNVFEETDGDDLTVGRENLTRGQHFFAQLTSSGPVSAGERVIITVGTRTFDLARANDMTLHSRSDYQWFISSVEVRITP
ncbi:MAG: hypothetical protein L6Q99_12320 [Planctomycetes bacterium]|nr:hypothetical protein [Planctomycetota bacterium]